MKYIAFVFALSLIVSFLPLHAATIEDPDYLCFTAEQAGSTVALTKKGTPDAVSLDYSIDNKQSWNTYEFGNAITLSKKGGKVYFRATSRNSTFSLDQNKYYQFAMSGKIAGSGNIMSLLDNTCQQDSVPGYAFYKLFCECTSLTFAPKLPAMKLKGHCYREMFKGCTKLVTAPELPAMEVAEHCYREMFKGCKFLTTAPKLPATTLAKGCYYAMFEGCAFLRFAPELPAEKLENECYYAMFEGCTFLRSAPELKATTLADLCYQSMFNGCTSLVSAPELPAEKLAERCYRLMFANCKSLTTAPELPAMKLEKHCYSYMFSVCTKLATVPKLPATTLAESCYGRMFENCTSLTTAPKLPATALTESCYSGMFYGCTSLVNAPELKAEKLEKECYEAMFYGCTSLVSASELPATTLAEGCYSFMFQYCTSLVTAPTLPATTLAKKCYYMMFQNCTSLNAIEVGFSSWPVQQEALTNWVSCVAAKGVFTAPCKLQGKYGENYIPYGWKKAGCYTIIVQSDTPDLGLVGAAIVDDGSGQTTPTDIDYDTKDTLTDIDYKTKVTLYLFGHALPGAYFISWGDGNNDPIRTVSIPQDITQDTTYYDAYFNDSPCGNDANWPVVERYSWLLMLNMKIIHEMGYDFEEDAVRWYRVQGDPDDVNQPISDDELVCNGYSLTIDRNLAGTGSYYAVIDLPSSQEIHGALCEGKVRSEIITVKNPIPDVPKVYLSPTLAEANSPLLVSGLVPEETTIIRIFSATGQLLQEYRSQQQSEYTVRAFPLSGCYYMHIENTHQIATLPYIVK